MLNERDAGEIKEMIRGLYELSGISPVWDGTVNDRVAEIFAIMIFETQKCSRAFAWVPKPSGGKPSPLWLVSNLTNGVFRTHSQKLSVTCARQVILNWGRELELAELGLSYKRIDEMVCTS